jgi:hypothetical protein
MKKTLTMFCLFFVLGCATAEKTNKQEKISPMDRVSQALEKILLPK